MKVTLKDIAYKAHVSTSLVSKVLNNREVRISEKKKQQILKIAQEFGYQPRTPAPVAAPHSSKKLIGLIQPSFDFSFLVQMTKYIQQYAHENGYEVVILNSNEDVEQERRCIDICEACGVDGILLNSCDNHANLERLQLLKGTGMPLVFLDRYIYDFDCDFVSSDNYDGAYRLTKYLIDKGHRDILYIFHGGAIFTTVQHERFAGYQACMSDHGLQSIKEYVYTDRSLKYQPIYQISNDASRFTATLLSTSWDFMLLFELLDQMHYNPDKRLDVAAFDDFMLPYGAAVNKELFARINPEIAIIRQDAKGMGEKAMDFLIERIRKRGQQLDEPKRVLLKTELVTIGGGL